MQKELTIMRKGMQIIKNQGLITFYSKVLHYFLNKVLKYKELLIFEKQVDDHIPAIKTRIKVDANITTIETFNTLKINGKIKKVLVDNIRKGNLCFVIINNKKLIHHSCVSFKDKYRAPIDDTIVIRENEAYIYGCWTSPEYRGISLYPYMLTEIVHYLRDKSIKRVFIDVWVNKIASMKGIKKAGFHKLGIYRRFEIFNLIDVHLTTKNLRDRFLDTNKVRLKLYKKDTKHD